MDAAQCPACGTENPADAKFCGSCGAALGLPCPSCGRRNPPDGRFCTSCGAGLAAAADPAVGSRQTFMPAGLADKMRAGSADIEGERKLITVLFADVAGYAALSERIDPEDLRALMRRAFDVMLEAVHRFEGTVAQLQGDGLLALFGAPIAHEDHATRALLAGLALQEGLAPLQLELAERDIDLRVRVGIHSGLVVFGRIGTDLEFTFQAVGDTVNTASRVQGLAEPGTVVASEATHRLAAGYFVFDDLGAHTVKNKAEPVQVYRRRFEPPDRDRVSTCRRSAASARTSAGNGSSRCCASGTNPRAPARDRSCSSSARPGSASRGSSTSSASGWRTTITSGCWGGASPTAPTSRTSRSSISSGRPAGSRRATGKLRSTQSSPRRVEEVGGDPAHLPYLRFLLSIDPGDPSVLEEDPMLRKPRMFEAFRDVLVAAVASPARRCS